MVFPSHVTKRDLLLAAHLVACMHCSLFSLFLFIIILLFFILLHFFFPKKKTKYLYDLSDLVYVYVCCEHVLFLVSYMHIWCVLNPLIHIFIF